MIAIDMRNHPRATYVQALVTELIAQLETMKVERPGNSEMSLVDYHGRDLLMVAHSAQRWGERELYEIRYNPKPMVIPK